MTRRLPILAIAVLAVSAAACKPKNATTTPSPTGSAGGAATSGMSATDSARVRAETEARERAAREARERAEREAREAAARTAAAAETARTAAITAARNTMATVIYFDFDRSDLVDASRAALDAKLPILRANEQIRIRISGHADERGSDAYNVALGQRRAAAAKRYLVDAGIAEGRIEVVSFGEDRPAVMGSDEAAWSKNRRDEFEIIIGGETLRAP